MAIGPVFAAISVKFLTFSPLLPLISLKNGRFPWKMEEIERKTSFFYEKLNIFLEKLQILAHFLWKIVVFSKFCNILFLRKMKNLTFSWKIVFFYFPSKKVNIYVIGWKMKEIINSCNFPTFYFIFATPIIIILFPRNCTHNVHVSVTAHINWIITHFYQYVHQSTAICPICALYLQFTCF